MANPSRRGQVTGPVSGQIRGDKDTPFSNTHFILPYGLQLKQTKNAGDTSVTIPTGITFVYAIAVGGGGGGNASGAGGAGDYGGQFGRDSDHHCLWLEVAGHRALSHHYGFTLAQIPNRFSRAYLACSRSSAR